ncbi:MAG: YDG domain-containing protein [Thermoguttaceae bacterium]|nr:YDG domain-containing protein [Thermoguttaceae bacterium]
MTSGFVAQFSDEIETSTLNLYDTQSGALGQADVVLEGAAAGQIAGSILVTGKELTFIKTGRPLEADTYTVTLRSAADGIVGKALGELLDGDGDGVAGGDFVQTFTVAASQPLVVSLPDFACGPGQALSGPAEGSGAAFTEGLPVRLDDAGGVTSVLLTIDYDPALLTISGAELGADAPDGSQVEINVDTPGRATVALFSLSPLESGSVDFVRLIGSVPENATYGAAQVLRISELKVNAGAIEATADDALHAVAFPGDANANGNYDTEDARFIARVGVGLDSGFAVEQPDAPATSQLRHAYPTIDPMIIGDVTGDGTLSPMDASDLLRQVVGLPAPNIPPLPSDTSVSTATTLTASAGSSVYGESLTFTATVSATIPGGEVPTGSVVFKEGANTLATVALVDGVATWTTSALDAGSHTITAVYDGAAGFYASTASANLVIAKATLSVTGITVEDKVYDGTTDATLNLEDAALEGVLDGEDVVLVTTGAVGTFDDADAGEGKPLTVTGLSLGGAQSANYTLAEVVLAADITAAELTISSLAANNKVYDGTTDATLDLEGAVLVGVFEGDNVSLAGGTAVFADPGVGEGITVTVTGLELAGPSAGNYVLSETTASLAADITAKTLSVTGITVEDKVYDGTTDATLNLEDAALEGVVDGEDVVLVTTEAAAAFADPEVGEGKPVTVTGLSLSGAQSANYMLADLVLTADITA